MRCTLVLEFDSGAGEPPRRVEALRLHRDTENPTEGDVGLTLAEAKTVLLSIQQEFVGEQLNQYCAARRACHRCSAVRKLHDSHCSEVCTVIGRVSYVRERWKGCACRSDGSRYISPLKTYLRETYTAELKWLHAKLGAMFPYRQALEILSLLLPSSGRDSHVTIRNHTIAIGQVVRTSTPPSSGGHSAAPIAELGIDVGYVRKARQRLKETDGSRETGAISILVAAVGPRGKRPRLWASAQPRTTKLQAEMTRFLASSGYDTQAKVQVISDAAKDLADLTDKLPHDSRWMLDWAHIGRKLWLIDQSITPLAYGRLTPNGSAFELWDLFVRFRCFVWTGQTLKWQEAGQRLYELLELREKVDTQGLEMQARLTRRRLVDALDCLRQAEHLAGPVIAIAGQQAALPILDASQDLPISRQTSTRSSTIAATRRQGGASLRDTSSRASIGSSVGACARTSTCGGLATAQTAWCRSASRYRTKNSRQFRSCTSDGPAAGAFRGHGRRRPTLFNGFATNAAH